MGLIIKDFVLDYVNKLYFLPSIQREFVWLDNQQDKKIEKLFDSLFQDYPIGNLLIWNISKNVEDSNLDFEVYEFINNWDEENTENETANLNGRPTLKLVLDGQQRLTALYLGLKGSRTFTRYRNKITQKLYINLFSNIETDPNNTYGWNYEIEFLEDKVAERKNLNNSEFWFEIGKVLDYEDAEDLKESLDSDIRARTTEPNIISKAKKILGTMHHVICTKDTCIAENETNTKDNEKALDIFIRTNDGATKLEKSDMLLSYMEANRDLFAPDGARKEIRKLLDEMNKEKVSKPRYYFDKDFILKASLALSNLPVQYRLKSFNKDNLQKISDNWPDIKKFLTITVELLGKAGFSDSNIISRNALIPIAYYLTYLRKDMAIVSSNSQDDTKIKKAIYGWFIISTFKKMFGSSSDTTLTNAREALKANKPISEVLEGSVVTKEEIEKIVEGARYQKPYTRLILMLISDIKYWDEFNEDHIYPKAKLTDVKYLKSIGLNDEKINEISYLIDSIGNLQLLGPLTNIKKSDEGFIEWKAKQNEEFLESMLVPKLENYSIVNFGNFVQKRKEMIVDKICEILEINKVPNNNDF
jgi:uncharacterized protein with ParB-like and HNH nuclease domain